MMHGSAQLIFDLSKASKYVPCTIQTKIISYAGMICSIGDISGVVTFYTRVEGFVHCEYILLESLLDLRIIRLRASLEATFNIMQC